MSTKARIERTIKKHPEILSNLSLLYYVSVPHANYSLSGR